MEYPGSVIKHVSAVHFVSDLYIDGRESDGADAEYVALDYSKETQNPITLLLSGMQSDLCYWNCWFRILMQSVAFLNMFIRQFSFGF